MDKKTQFQLMLLQSHIALAGIVVATMVKLYTEYAKQEMQKGRK